MTTVAESRSEATLRTIVRSLLPIGAVTVLVGFASAMASPFLSVFVSKSLNADPLHASLFLTLGPLSGVAVAAVLGHLSDRRAMRRRLLIVAALAGAAGHLAFAVIQHYWVLLVISMTLIAVAGSLVPQVYAHARQVLDTMGSTKVPAAMSTLRTLVSVAWVLGPPLAGFCFGLIGFPGLFGAAAAGFAAAAVVVVVWFREPLPAPPRPAAAEEEDAGSEPASAAGSEPAGAAGPEAPSETPARVWVTVLAFLSLQCATSLAVLVLPLFINEDLHGSLKDAGMVLGLCAALEIPLMVLFGVLATRIGTRRLVLIGAGFGIAYYSLVTIATSTWQVALAQILNACFISAVLGLGISHFQDMYPARPGHSTTLFTNTYRIAAMLAGPLFGVAQHVGYRFAYGACAGLCLLGLLLLAAVRDRDGKDSGSEGIAQVHLGYGEGEAR
ncbi:MAG: sugar efflux transporter [Micromonosporaceae bacterium]|nr:sugar efflux transporter [Micromonosporaceae bacterium]